MTSSNIFIVNVIYMYSIVDRTMQEALNLYIIFVEASTTITSIYSLIYGAN